MRRRDFIAAVGALAVGSLPLHAQTQKVTRIGLLTPSAPDAERTREVVAMMREVLSDFGYVEGKDVALEMRAGDGTAEGLLARAAELVALKVDIIVAIATPAARAAQQATRTIPIVAGSMGDPVQDGLVESLSHPGGNITGTTFLGPELVAKRLALLKELIPDVKRVAVLWNSKAFGEKTTADMVGQTNDAAKGLGIDLQYVEVRGLDAFEPAFAEARAGRAEALLAFPYPAFFENRKRLVELVGAYRAPTIYNAKEFVEIGGLMAYGASPIALNRRAALYVDRIIKGAKPADLPVEQPTVFDLAINRATARALGITIPSTLLAAATELID
jgi:putative ABC transport system substrate-binding protein